MLYHRLLTSALKPMPDSHDSPSTESPPLDFDNLWDRVGVHPDVRFSDDFMAQAGLTLSPAGAEPASRDQSLLGLTCLRDLTNAWRHAVEALNVDGVDDTLTLVYRSQLKKRKIKSAESQQKNPAGEPISPQEAQYLAAAIQASVSDLPAETGGDDELARAIFESLKDSVRSGPVGRNVPSSPFGPSLESDISDDWVHVDMLQDNPSMSEDLGEDPVLALAIQESLHPVPDVLVPQDAGEVEGEVLVAEGHDSLPSNIPPKLVVEQMDVDVQQGQETSTESEDSAAPTPAEWDGDSSDSGHESMTVQELEKASTIIGRKQFVVDDAFLDAYLTRVLAWWHGLRAPVGVDVELTRRCM